ncbi:MAG: hypothetical protein ACRDGS_10235 [Chloroflexota bacterium]
MAVVVALLDACVLYPAALRDTLLRAALRDPYRPQWSARIMDEVSRNLREDRGLTASLRPYGVEAQHPDTFLVHLFHLVPEVIVELLREQAAALKKPDTPFVRVLETLEQHVPVFVSWVRHYL